MMRTYSELIQRETLEERFAYLSLRGSVAESTFGFERWLNQDFYRSHEWRTLRHEVIARDLGQELGVYDVPIADRIHVHHMNPLTRIDLTEGTDNLLNPEFLISCGQRVHNAIHYGDASLLPKPYVERRPGDTIPWRRS